MRRAAAPEVGPIKTLPRARVALGGLAAALIATGAGALLFKVQDRISISQTARHAEDWYTNDTTRLEANAAGCKLEQTRRAIADGRVTTWTRAGCAPTTPGRLFVIGNSHALSYTPMLRQFALDTGHETRLYFRSGCAFLGLNVPMASLATCRRYLDAAEAEFRSELRPGDILFMPSMRLDQGTDQWGAVTAAFTDPVKGAAAMAEAVVVLDKLKATGAILVFEAPKPIVPAPVYRCVDWYLAENPICRAGLSIEKAAMLSMRAPVMAKIQTLAAGNDRVRVWDPLPTLCPGDRCQAMDGSAPIFFDRHHISTHGNRMLRTEFAAVFNPWFSN